MLPAGSLKLNHSDDKRLLQNDLLKLLLYSITEPLKAIVEGRKFV